MDYLAGIVTIIGMWFVMKKNRWGFIILVLNEGLWFYVLYQNPNTWGLLLPTFLITGIHIKAFRDWGKDGQET